MDFYVANEMFKRNLFDITLPFKSYSNTDLFTLFSQYWSPAVVYLHLALESQNETERIGFLATAFLSGFSNIHLTGVPIIPFVGETGQFIYQDGTQINLEMISSKKFSFLLFNTKGFLINGTLCLDALLSLGDLQIKWKGKITVHMPTPKQRGNHEGFKVDYLINHTEKFDVHLPSLLIRFIQFQKTYLSLEGQLMISFYQKPLCKVRFMRARKFWKTWEVIQLKGSVSGGSGGKIKGEWPFEIMVGERVVWNQSMIFKRFETVNRFLPSDVKRNHWSFYLENPEYEFEHEIFDLLYQQKIKCIRSNLNK